MYIAKHTAYERPRRAQRYENVYFPFFCHIPYHHLSVDFCFLLLLLVCSQCRCAASPFYHHPHSFFFSFFRSPLLSLCYPKQFEINCSFWISIFLRSLSPLSLALCRIEYGVCWCWSDSHVCIGYERWMRTKSIASRHFRHYYYLAIRTRCNIGGDQEPSHTRRCSHNRLWWNVMARPVVRDELGRQRRNSSGNIFTGVFMPLCAASFIDCLRGNHGKNV